MTTIELQDRDFSQADIEMKQSLKVLYRDMNRGILKHSHISKYCVKIGFIQYL